MTERDNDSLRKRIGELESRLSDRDAANSRLAAANKQLLEQVYSTSRLTVRLRKLMREYEKWGARGNTLGDILDICRKLC